MEEPTPNGPLSLGQQIAAAREQAGHTQAELAELAGINKHNMSRIERGVSYPSHATAQRLANTLSLPLTIFPSHWSVDR